MCTEMLLFKLDFSLLSEQSLLQSVTQLHTSSNTFSVHTLYEDHQDFANSI